MSLLPCPSCGKQISESASACPKCGHPLAPGWAVSQRTSMNGANAGCAIILGIPALCLLIFLGIHNLWEAASTTAPIESQSTAPVESQQVQLEQKSDVPMGFSKKQLMQSLDSQFVESSSPNADSSFATSLDNLAIIQTMGPSSNLTHATMILPVSSDASTSVIQSAYSLRFLQNIFPNWDGAGDWLTGAVGSLTTDGVDRVTTVQDGKLVEIRAAKEIGTISLSVGMAPKS